MDFLSNRTKLWEALDRCGWPLPETDVVLLENEIHQAEIYIRQATELLQAEGRGGDDVDTAVSSPRKEVTNYECDQLINHLFTNRVYGKGGMLWIQLCLL